MMNPRQGLAKKEKRKVCLGVEDWQANGGEEVKCGLFFLLEKGECREFEKKKRKEGAFVKEKKVRAAIFRQPESVLVVS